MSRLSALIIDPDTAAAAVIGQILKRTGHDMFHVKTGAEALSMLEKSRFDLIMLEMKLPDMRGAELILRLREKGIETTIMVISQDDTTDAKIRAYGAGADDYVTKPFHRDDLAQRILHLQQCSLADIHPPDISAP